MENQKELMPCTSSDNADTKMLGAHVPIELYWEFKKAAAARNEQLKDAIQHAARIYIDAGAKGGK